MLCLNTQSDHVCFNLGSSRRIAAAFLTTNNNKHAYLAAWLAIDNGVCGEAFSVLKMGKRFDGPPRFQVTGHTHGRPHLQTVIHPRFRYATAVQ